MAKEPGILTYTEIRAQTDAFQAVVDRLEGIMSVFAQSFQECRPEEVIFTGCGTSYHLAQASATVFTRYNDVPARAVPSSELFIHPEIHLKDRRILVVPFTRKASTTEVRLALAEARKRSKVKTMAISCDAESELLNDFYVPCPADDEQSVVMTKSFSSMLYIALFLALSVAGKRELIAKAKDIPAECPSLLERADVTGRSIMMENRDRSLFIFLGQGPFFGLAGEAMVKMKEMSLANAEAYHSLEYRHGPISLAGSDTLVTLFASAAAADYERKLLAELKALGAKTFVLAHGLAGKAATGADYRLDLGAGQDDFLHLPLAIIPAQLLAYHFARGKGLDLDTPRNLAQAIVLD